MVWSSDPLSLAAAAALSDVVSSARAALQQQIDQTSQAERTCRTTLERLVASINDDRDSISRSKKRLEYVSSSDEEEVPASAITGECDFAFAAKQMKPTPNFKVHIVSAYPILRYTAETSEGSSWKKPGVTFIPGDVTVSGIIKNKMFGPAHATLKFYTWRNKMHTAEIEHLEGTIRRCEESKEEKEKEKTVVLSTLSGLVTRRDLLDAEIKPLNADLTRIDKGPHKSKETLVALCLAAGSISGVASCLNLQASWPKSVPPTEGPESRLRVMRRIMETAEKHTQDAAEDLSAALDKSIDATSRLSAAASCADSQFAKAETLIKHALAASSRGRRRFEDLASDAVAKNTSETAIRRLKAFEDSLKEAQLTITRNRDSVERTVKNAAEAGEATEQLQLRAGVSESILQTKHDKLAWARAQALIDREPQPLGLSTALAQPNTSAGHCVSIYNGERILVGGAGESGSSLLSL